MTNLHNHKRSFILDCHKQKILLIKFGPTSFHQQNVTGYWCIRT